MKYKVGDKVKVIEFERLEKKFSFERKLSNGRVFTKDMQRLCGKVVTIKTVYDSWYKIHEDGWCWDDNMFEPVNTKKIVITSDGVETLARLYDGNKVIKTATAKCSPEDTFDFETGARIAFDRLIESPLTKALKSLRDAAANVAKNIKPLKFEVGKQYTDGELVIEITKANREIRSYDYKVIKGEDRGPSKFFQENSTFGTRLTPYDPPKYYNGKVVCIKSPYSWWTVGKVYNVVDGIITANDGDTFPKGCKTPYINADDIRHAGNDGHGDQRHNPENEFIPFVE